MSDLVLYGPPQSSYVRTARMTCIEKGVPHRLESIELGSAEHGKLHPWSRVPILEHDDLFVYETSAIQRYVDDAFTGPRLTPAGHADRARMEQWVSAINCYVYDEVIRSYALRYVLPMLRGTEPDRAAIDAAIPKLERDLGLLDEAYARGPWIAGETFCLADLLAAPILQTVSMFPEGKAALAKRRNLSRAFENLAARESFKTVHAGVFG